MRFVSVRSFANAARMMSLACLIATVQLGAPSAAAVAKEVPIKGKLQSVESFDFQFATLFVDGSGSGNATHLGWYTVTYEWEVDLQTLVGIGTFHFIAANGDSLFTEATGVAIPTEDPDVLFTEAMHTIVGGTGRFEGAGGEFTAVGLLNAVTGVRSDTLRGTLIK